MRSSLRLIVAAALALLAASCDRPKEGGGANPAALAASQAEADAFMAKNAKEPGIKVTASGLQYKIERSGPEVGPHPGPRDEVKVNYVGSLTNGQVFDTTNDRGAPAIFGVGGLIPGWMEALQLMRPGDVWIVYVPPKLGYGEEGAGGGQIPPNSVLVFRLELLGVLQAGGGNALG